MNEELKATLQAIANMTDDEHIVEMVAHCLSLVDKPDITPPEVLAEQFAGLNSELQARFFNHVAECSSKWEGLFCMQLQAITDEDALTLGGRRVMQGIGEYSHWGLVPSIDRGKKGG